VGGSLEAVIENIVFVGSDLHLHGRLGNGLPVVALERHARGSGGLGLAPGQTVTLHYQATAPHLMKSGAP
ncbi:MAG TPA: TOBE domain-containing protein, partial [Nordella sp.]|nr:TOBE domain-containing protein [Nordella sp.]